MLATLLNLLDLVWSLGLLGVILLGSSNVGKVWYLIEMGLWSDLTG